MHKVGGALYVKLKSTIRCENGILFRHYVEKQNMGLEENWGKEKSI